MLHGWHILNSKGRQTNTLCCGIFDEMIRLERLSLKGLAASVHTFSIDEQSEKLTNPPPKTTSHTHHRLSSFSPLKNPSNFPSSKQSSSTNLLQTVSSASSSIPHCPSTQQCPSSACSVTLIIVGNAVIMKGDLR